MTATTRLNRAAVTAMTVTIDPETLGDIDQATFVSALENEFTAAGYVHCALLVRFRPSLHDAVESVRWADGPDLDSADVERDIWPLTERAWAACCRQES